MEGSDADPLAIERLERRLRRRRPSAVAFFGVFAGEGLLRVAREGGDLARFGFGFGGGVDPGGRRETTRPSASDSCSFPLPPSPAASAPAVAPVDAPSG